jgi:hypothetical protein
MARESIVTTGDLKQEYEIIGPIYFQVSNKGIFFSALSKLAKQYETEIAQMKKQGRIGQARADWGFLYGGFLVILYDAVDSLVEGDQQGHVTRYYLGQDSFSRAYLLFSALIGNQAGEDVLSNRVFVGS